MQIRFTGQNIDITPALREFTQEKFERIKRFSDLISNIHVIFNVDKFRQIAEAQIKLHGSEIHACSEAEKMYDAVEDLVDKVVKQLAKYKEKHQAH